MAIFHIGQRLSLVLELAFRLTFSRDINVAFLVFLLSYKTYMRLKCSVEVYNHIAGIFFFFFRKQHLSHMKEEQLEPVQH